MLIAANEKERLEHVSSGKLSAGKLGDPLQWQILKVLGAPTKDHDEYVLRKFKRGKDVEEWYTGCIPNVLDKNVFVEYRDVVGYIDAYVDTEGWNFPRGKMPLEVKSVTGMKFKRIVKEGPQRGHCLQAGLYALAKGDENFALSYIASDDYRVHTFLERTADWKPIIDGIINRFDTQLSLGVVPVFVSEEKWQENPEYNSYPDWSGLDAEGIAAKVEALGLSFKK